MQQEFEIELEKIQDLHTDAATRTGKFLTKHGWSLSCLNPRSLWYWEKVIDGRNFTLNANSALAMEEQLLWREFNRAKVK